MTSNIHKNVPSEGGTSRRPAPPWADTPAVGPILRPPEAATYYGVALSTYYVLVKRGEVPGFIKLSKLARASGVPQGWLDAAISARAGSDPS